MLVRPVVGVRLRVLLGGGMALRSCLAKAFLNLGLRKGEAALRHAARVALEATAGLLLRDCRPDLAGEAYAALGLWDHRCNLRPRETDERRPAMLPFVFPSCRTAVSGCFVTVDDGGEATVSFCWSMPTEPRKNCSINNVGYFWQLPNTAWLFHSDDV
ncbi:hypothetical protein HPB50_011605 [Hyalomma asiaticum]|uniref:Uncharacterized protein n=1 Tax=Hyalomma asiaticum TaxID=266040 RepID=A0ACB7SMM5_HYAAI|nr:hypothetical protein HPB50_011605 [Hyalomma asiaticum]